MKEFLLIKVMSNEIVLINSYVFMEDINQDERIFVVYEKKTHQRVISIFH